jgi:hypothetical protein
LSELSGLVFNRLPQLNVLPKDNNQSNRSRQRRGPPKPPHRGKSEIPNPKSEMFRISSFVLRISPKGFDVPEQPLLDERIRRYLRQRERQQPDHSLILVRPVPAIGTPQTQMLLDLLVVFRVQGIQAIRAEQILYCFVRHLSSLNRALSLPLCQCFALIAKLARRPAALLLLCCPLTVTDYT